jgi:hypothetical protein
MRLLSTLSPTMRKSSCVLAFGFICSALVSYFIATRRYPPLLYKANIYSSGFDFGGGPFCSGPNASEYVGISITVPSVMYVGERGSVQIHTNGHISPATQIHGVEFLVSGAGMEVEPKEWLPLQQIGSSDQLSATWSIRTIEEGQQHLVINSKNALDNLLSTGPNGKEYHLTRLRLEPGADIPIQVKAKWANYLPKIWTLLAAFMGSLLTLPGILAFLKDRKKDRQSTFGPPLDSVV